MNKVFLIGNLTKDPDMRVTKDGKNYVNFTLAVNKANNGVDYFPVVVWDKLAGICGKYLLKGSHVLVEGSLNTRSYDDKKGVKRYVTEIIADSVEFLGKAKAEAKEDVKPLEPAEQVTDENLPY